jgi:hypothetical protein
MNAISKKRERIESALQKYNQQLKELQYSCGHPNVQKKHRANTGNYDPSSNYYWTEFTCPDCKKFWTEDGSK